MNSSSVVSLDIDECRTDNGGCDDSCINTQGSFLCFCDVGFSLSADRLTCQGRVSNKLLHVCMWLLLS